MNMVSESVVDRQNSPRGIALLRARSEIYRRAQNLLNWQLALTVVVPFVGAIVGIIWTEARGYVAAVSFAITIFDAGLLDRAQRNQLKLGARVSEVFDTEILDLPWSAHVAGTPPNPEQINEAAVSWSEGDDELKDWYPRAVERAPIHLARIICQRTNLWYDAEIRRKYSGILLGVAIASIALLSTLGMIEKITLLDFAATILTPAAPILVWTLRDFYRQRDTADSQNLARAEVERLWGLVLSGQCADEECSRRSRELQNTIFARRASSPLVFPGIYKRLRPRMETQMNAGAEELLAQAGFGK